MCTFQEAATSHSFNRMEFTEKKQKMNEEPQQSHDEKKEKKKIELKSISTTKNMKEKRLKFVSVPKKFEYRKTTACTTTTTTSTTTTTRQQSRRKKNER